MTRVYERKHAMPVGSRWGRWTIVEERPPGQCMVLARCDCGTVKRVSAQGIREGKNRHCSECRDRERADRSARRRAEAEARSAEFRRRCDARWRPPVGTVFGWLTTTGPAENRKGQGGSHVPVRCRCGTEKWVRVSSLLRGVTTACGCRQRGPRADCPLPGREPTFVPRFVKGQQFGELTVLRTAKPGDLTVLTRCSCGAVRYVRRDRLQSGRTTACWGHRHGGHRGTEPPKEGDAA